MTQTKQLNAFVTGANGFLGLHLCRQLLGNNWHVFALCRDTTLMPLAYDNLTLIEGDILAPENFTKAIPKNINALFHTAASTNTWFKNNSMQNKTNLQGTQNMLDLALNKNITRFIHVSSVVVYGIHKKKKNITENMPKIGEESWINYVKTKTQSEELVLNRKDLDCVIINPTHIIGPGDKHNWARLIKMIAEQKLPSIPNGAGSFVDVRDVAAGIIAAFSQGKKGENYLLGGTDMDFKQFVQMIANKLNVKATTVQLPNLLLIALAQVKNLISRFTNKEPDITPESVTLISDLYGCDSAKAKKELSYQNRAFTTTIDDTLQFLKEEDIINSEK